VRNLSDVETLGATSRINTDKTGTLTMNEMTVRALFNGGQWYTVDGEGYAASGRVRGVAGAPETDFLPLAYVSALASDATVSMQGDVVGDPTEAAVVVLAGKLGVSVEETRAQYPRVATVPFDSEYKLMATFHRLPYGGAPRVVGLVKGAPDVVLQRCTHALEGREVVPLEKVHDRVEDAITRLGEHGLRVLAMAVRLVDPADEASAVRRPMEALSELTLLGLVGIVDPLRPEAVESVRLAQAAGIEVRMITGDHLLTAQAIAEELGLGPGGITGRDFAAATDEEVVERLDALQVFGRVSPEDKLRLVRLLQEDGNVVAMTGDAVNDAAALKQADIGVAMGSGSEVSKQAAKMVLTNDDFSTLVHAIELGRGIYARITAYIGYQMVQLFALIGMFLLATALNVNSGVALLPLQVLFLNFTLAVVPVVIIALDRPEPGLMDQAPRDPSARVFNRTTALRWVGLGALLAALSLAPVALGPDAPASDTASVSVTMGFVVMGLSTALAGFVMRKDRAAAVTGPLVLPAALTAGAGVLVVTATEWAPLQGLLLTTDLTGVQWLACLGLALTFALVVEVEKAWRRTR
jgi:P-type Ca2+ transporter type 2C